DARVAENEQLRIEIEQIRVQESAAREELEQLRNQAVPGTLENVEETKLRSELAEAQAELARLEAQLAESGDSVGLEERLQAAESERIQLENELDLLRHRGAELVEQLAEQKRTAA